ncbi:hypothetical protein BKM31_04170 [[Actinomadura] parvosata subsp. kistnae]|uniref:Uncharacterized protein n=1 Tax=[Actinomadura] parvosata subsp. kistnae TaxID=1909395 RepID=A0A1U9ZS82_9ACTN|nr:hypothetical protein BKM31_04170 [Nonomuraea sp. ATCC 55076]
MPASASIGSGSGTVRSSYLRVARTRVPSTVTSSTLSARPKSSLTRLMGRAARTVSLAVPVSVRVPGFQSSARS